MKLFCMPLVAGTLATAAVADIYVWESFTDASGGINAPTGGNGTGSPSLVVVMVLHSLLGQGTFTTLPVRSPCTFTGLGL